MTAMQIIFLIVAAVTLGGALMIATSRRMMHTVLWLVLTLMGVAVLFGTGAYLLLKQDLVRVVAGMVLISNAANLFIMSARLSDGSEPIYPLVQGGKISDPLVQAMAFYAENDVFAPRAFHPRVAEAQTVVDDMASLFLTNQASLADVLKQGKQLIEDLNE